MKTKLVLGAVAAAVAVFSQGAFAQAASSPSRADVKAEAKKGRPRPAPAKARRHRRRPKQSDKTRDERKADDPGRQRSPAISSLPAQPLTAKDDKAASSQAFAGRRAPSARPRPRTPSRRPARPQPAGEGPDAPKK